MTSRTVTINIHDADATTVTCGGNAEGTTSWLSVQVTEEKEVNVFLTVPQMRALAASLTAEADRCVRLMRESLVLEAEAVQS